MTDAFEYTIPSNGEQPTIRIYKDRFDRWRWKVDSHGGHEIARSSMGFEDKDDAASNMRILARALMNALRTRDPALGSALVVDLNLRGDVE